VYIYVFAREKDYGKCPDKNFLSQNGVLCVVQFLWS